MKLSKVHATYFSPTGTTRTVVSHLAEGITALLPDAVLKVHDFTLPEGRKAALVVRRSELAVVGLPVYAGRLPNLLLKYLATWVSDGAFVVPVVVFGNRSYGNALAELQELLENSGFHAIAAAAFVGQHSFSGKLAAGRPDREDLETASRFATEIVRRVNNIRQESLSAIKVPGQSGPDHGGYYKPKGIDGEVVNFLKVKPVTTDACTNCKHCAEVCPMGAIDRDNPSIIPGICIKCNACIKYCPVHAKQLTDEAYLSHVRFLENTYISRAEIVLF